LIELLIVLSLITLVLGLSLPYFTNSLPNARLEEAARETATMMRYAEAQVRLDNTDQTLVVDMDANRCSLEGKMDRAIPAGLRMKVIDPFLGEVATGKYRMIFPSTGSIEGATIVISSERKALSVMTDPIVGSVIVRNENR
jgi:Tfp pilus assembly protein FimT